MIVSGKVIYNQIDDLRKKIQDLDISIQTLTDSDTGRFSKNILYGERESLKANLSKLENQKYTIGDLKGGE